MKPENLPVYQHRERIIAEVTANNVLVVESPTGSGKTTQIPLILHKSGILGEGIIGVTQPRRIAAISVCEYMAKQIGSSIPGAAGYKIRFADKTNQDTVLKIMTDGILLQELKADPMLSKYSLIMVDEAHERSLNIDFTLGLLKQVLRSRPDFKVIISSATINAEVFSNYFDGCPILHIDAHAYPVDIRYTPPQLSDNQDALIDKIVDLTAKRMKSPECGDFLIFLPGERLITDCVRQLISMDKKRLLHILPIFGRLPKEEQERVFYPTPEGKHKVVVATNIAETSITIDNIRTVIDSGLAKINYYNQRTFTSSLIEQPISKASCNQRKGRAGRTAPGVCYRLYEKEDYNRREMFTLEEIRRTDLSEVILRMAELGINDFESFDFITDPGYDGLSSAVETLHLLDAIDKEHNLTTVGDLMVRFPLLPRFSRIIVEAIIRYHDVLEESIIAASFLSARSPFIMPPGEEIEARHAHHAFSSPNGDFFTYVDLYRAYTRLDSDSRKEKFCKKYYLEKQTMNELVNIVFQLSEIVSDMGIPIASGGAPHDYLCSIATGLVQFVCIKTGKNVYRSLTADRIHIHPGSILFRSSPQFFVAGEIVRTTRMFARSVSPLKRAWLMEIHRDLSSRLLQDSSRSGRSASSSGSDSASNTKGANSRKPQTVLFFRTEYPVEPYKGNKKLAVIPFEDLFSKQKQILKGMKQYNNLRLKVTYNSFWFHKGDRLPSIMKAIPHMKPENGIIDHVPSGIFNPVTDPELLIDNLPLLLCFCKIKKEKKNLGFITLDTDKHGNFRFKVTKNFHTAVDSALFSLEVLADTIDNSTSKTLQKQLNRVFREMNTIYES